VVGFGLSFFYYCSGRWKRRGSLAEQPPDGKETP